MAIPASGFPMSTDRLRWCLDCIGWGQRELARILEVDESTIRKMARGKHAIPEHLAEWLETLAAVHFSHPLPKGWNR